MAHDSAHRVTLTLRDNYRFDVRFDEALANQTIVVDEAPPLGGGRGPTPAALLAAAAANCLAASLLFCLRKTRAEVKDLTVSAVARTERNEAGRLRISRIDVEIAPDVAADDVGRLLRCEGLFEDFCIVTASVRRGIPVTVSVKDATSTEAA
jgi:uncharacterized OsmC-like protein